MLRHHLGLIVPEPAQACRIRVGDEVHHWAEGKSLLFDDTYDHEAWNGIGVLDAGLAGGLTLYGVPAVHATAAVLVYHAIALWVPGAGGLAAYVAGQHRLGSTQRCDTSTG